MGRILLLLVALSVVACGPSKPRHMTVWDVYDVRHPVPAGSAVPQSRATYYDQFHDNDEFYTPPVGLCAPGEYAAMGCQ